MNAYICDACSGSGQSTRYTNVDPDTCWKCGGAGDLLLSRLDRIAVALETIASDITDWRERERATQQVLIDEHDRLRTHLRECLARYDRVENDRLGESYWRGVDRAADAATNALEAFEAAHPEIVAQAEAVSYA